MKVLQLITGLGAGGAEQVVADLATRLDRQRFQTSVCSIYDVSGEQGVHVRRLQEAGVDVLSLGVRRKWQVGRAMSLQGILRDRQPDILHCHLFHANVLGRWAGSRCGVPHIISTVHIAERRRRPWRFWLERRTDRLGTITVCVSRAALEFQSGRTGLPPDRFLVIPNGVDTARFGAPARSREEVLADLGIRPGARFVGSVGRLDPQKGYRHLMRAFLGMAKTMPDLELVIAGEGRERGPLREQADRWPCAGRVHLIGRRTDVPDLLHAFDLFVMPSIYEGFGLALVEAMAAGVPVVASAVDSLPEILGADEPEGPFGRLVPPADPVRLAEAIREALAKPASEQVNMAQARARRDYDVGTMIRRYAELYERYTPG